MIAAKTAKTPPTIARAKGKSEGGTAAVISNPARTVPHRGARRVARPPSNDRTITHTRWCASLTIAATSWTTPVDGCRIANETAEWFETTRNSEVPSW